MMRLGVIKIIIPWPVQNSKIGLHCNNTCFQGEVLLKHLVNSESYTSLMIIEPSDLAGDLEGTFGTPNIYY